MKKCPYCRKPVKDDADKCAYCKAALPETDSKKADKAKDEKGVKE